MQNSLLPPVVAAHPNDVKNLLSIGPKTTFSSSLTQPTWAPPNSRTPVRRPGPPTAPAKGCVEPPRRIHWCILRHPSRCCPASYSYHPTLPNAPPSDPQRPPTRSSHHHDSPSHRGTTQRWNFSQHGSTTAVSWSASDLHPRIDHSGSLEHRCGSALEACGGVVR
jgi:hypothetical protein